ncbi:hypothetical protein test1122_08325 [Streptomyces gobiensis]|nr:hypothetical protein test1122_08325 [Streptomyces gobiensis]
MTEPESGAARVSAAVELPYDLPGGFGSRAAEEVWDLWLRPGGPKTPRVRLGRLRGDLSDRKKTDVVPKVRLGESETGLWLFFTLSNNVALELKPLPREADSGPVSVFERPGQDLRAKA